MSRAAAAVRHRPVIERGIDAWGHVYRMRCTCGASGEAHDMRGLAERDLNEHVRALPEVPPPQRCRHPKEHDWRAWEPCQVCAGQLELFDLQETLGGPAADQPQQRRRRW